MVKKRLIPKLLLKKIVSFQNQEKYLLVNTNKYSGFKIIGDPVSQAKIYQAQAADELILLDISPNFNERTEFIEIIRKVSEEIFMPITVGGGVESLKDFKLFLDNGADKVSINSHALNNPEILKEASESYGRQCVISSIDVKKENNGEYFVWKDGGKTKTNFHPVEWAGLVQEHGAGEILLSSINCDGMKKGMDLAIIKQVVEAVNIPVIASGGCGQAQHITECFLQTGVPAVAAGTFFSLRDQNPIQARSHVKNAGIEIRIIT